MLKFTRKEYISSAINNCRRGTEKQKKKKFRKNISEKHESREKSDLVIFIVLFNAHLDLKKHQRVITIKGLLIDTRFVIFGRF